MIGTALRAFLRQTPFDAHLDQLAAELDRLSIADAKQQRDAIVAKLEAIGRDNDIAAHPGLAGMAVDSVLGSRSQPTRPQPPRPRISSGVGDNFARIAAALRYPECTGCSALKSKMNANTPEWNLEHIDEHLDEMEARAKSRGWKWWRAGAAMAIKLACRLAPKEPFEIEGELETWQNELAG